MNYGTHPGWIEVICGVMFSGKSEELIRRVRRAIIARRRVQVFKSHLDARYAGLYSVSSHDGTELDASPVDSAAEIFRLVRPDVHLGRTAGRAAVCPATELLQFGAEPVAGDVVGVHGDHHVAAFDQRSVEGDFVFREIRAVHRTGQRP